MVKFQTVHPLDEFFSKISGDVNPDNGVSIKSIEGHGLVQVFAANGKTSTVERALGIKETPGKSSITKDYTAIPISPGQWMVMSASSGQKDFAKGIVTKLKKNGYVSEQSDARVIFRVSGQRARELMQKGCRLDLHPSVASKGWCAQTQMAQMGVILHQVDDNPTYDVAVYSGFAHDFAEWLLHTGAQLGISFERE